MVKTKPFKVTLKDSTKTDKLWNYYRASKPQMTEDEIPPIEDILKMGLPINGLKYYVIEFQSSLLFRDLILSQRDIMGAWAVSNRVAKINSKTTPMSDEIEVYLNDWSQSHVYEDLEAVYKRIENGEPQEYVKGDLPLMTLTKFTVGIDLRTLVNFLYTLEVHAPEYFNYVGNKIIEALDMKEIYKNHPKRDKFKELALDKKEKSSGQVGTMYQIYKPDISMNLLAQVVRKNIIVHSEVWNLLDEDKQHLWMKQTKDTVGMTIYLTEENLHSLQSTRCCWFAQMDKASNQSWDYILHDLIEGKSPSKFLADLPCHGCGKYCVILGDMMARVDRIDSHFYPCPLICEDATIIDERVQKYQSDSTIMKKWKEAGEMIPFNPENDYYKRYRSKE